MNVEHQMSSVQFFDDAHIQMPVSLNSFILTHFNKQNRL